MVEPQGQGVCSVSCCVNLFGTKKGCQRHCSGVGGARGSLTAACVSGCPDCALRDANPVFYKVQCPSLLTGIFAYMNYRVPRTRKQIFETLIRGLQRLEYRGYDSAGRPCGLPPQERKACSVRRSENSGEVKRRNKGKGNMHPKCPSSGLGVGVGGRVGVSCRRIFYFHLIVIAEFCAVTFSFHLSRPFPSPCTLPNRLPKWPRGDPPTGWLSQSLLL